MSHQEDFFQYLAQTSPTPIAIEVARAEGIYIYDSNGKEYMDMISGVSVNNLGHKHPSVISAIKNQIDKYLHVMVYGEFIQEPQTILAKKIASIMPNSLSCSYFVNSGTEANEAAIKLAKRYTGRTEIVAMKKSYHGSTHGSLSITGNESKKYFVRPLLPDVRFIEFDEMDVLSNITEKTACVITEPIQGDAGVRIPSIAYMQALRRRCDEVGALLIFDEVQTGYGRTGTFFAFESTGVVPDILTIGKAMAGGMPMGGFISSKEIMDTLSHNPMLGHITTFGGHPVMCAAASATIDAIIEEKIVDKVQAKGDYLASILQHRLVKEIRYKGLFFAVEMESFDVVEKVVKGCLDEGLIGFWFISCNNAFRLAPPLTITMDELKKAGEIICKVMDKVKNNQQ